MIAQGELAEDQQELITPPTEVAEVDVQNSGDMIVDVVDSDRLGVELQQGHGFMMKHCGTKIRGRRTTGWWRIRGPVGAAAASAAAQAWAARSRASRARWAAASRSSAAAAASACLGLLGAGKSSVARGQALTLRALGLDGDGGVGQVSGLALGNCFRLNLGGNRGVGICGLGGGWRRRYGEKAHARGVKGAQHGESRRAGSGRTGP